MAMQANPSLPAVYVESFIKIVCVERIVVCRGLDENERLGMTKVDRRIRMIKDMNDS